MDSEEVMSLQSQSQFYTEKRILEKKVKSRSFLVLYCKLALKTNNSKRSKQSQFFSFHTANWHRKLNTNRDVLKFY